MSRGAQVFRQTDVTKAAKATLNAGLAVQRIEIDQAGKIVVIVGKAAADDLNSSAVDDWSDVRGEA